MKRLLLLLLLAFPALASTITSASITGLGTTTVSAIAIAEYGPPCPACGPDPGFISASAHAAGRTLGPVRDGFIRIFGDGGVWNFGNASGSIGAYTFGCNNAFCTPVVTKGVALPFTLGVPFSIGIEVSSYAAAFGGSAAGITFSFSVFESLLTPGFSAQAGEIVAIRAASNPEPATWLLMGSGLALLWRLRPRR